MAYTQRALLVGNSPLLGRIKVLLERFYKSQFRAVDCSARVVEWGNDALRDMLEYRPTVVVMHFEDDGFPTEEIKKYGSKPAVIALHAANLGAGLIHISDPYVFPGRSEASADDEPYPVSIFGFARLMAERSIRSLHPKSVLMRVGWLYGPEYPESPPMIAEDVRRGDKTLAYAFTDLLGSPTYVGDAAIIIGGSIGGRIATVATLPPVTVHVAPTDVTDWFSYLKDYDMHPTSFMRSKYHATQPHRNAGLIPTRGFEVPPGSLRRFRQECETGVWDIAAGVRDFRSHQQVMYGKETPWDTQIRQR